MKDQILCHPNTSPAEIKIDNQREFGSYKLFLSSEGNELVMVKQKVVGISK